MTSKALHFNFFGQKDPKGPDSRHTENRSIVSLVLAGSRTIDLLHQQLIIQMLNGVNLVV